MSEAKAQNKASAGPQKAKAEKSDSGTKGATEAAKSAVSTPTEKTESAPKSASQTSISHFSSVSTPAYKKGWEDIFGKLKKARTTGSNADNDQDYPDRLTIDDDVINEELRSALYKAFQRQARAQGFSLARIKKQVDLIYSIECNLKTK